MFSFDQALDDYLHTIVRTQPWIKAREEDLLATFGEWLAMQPRIPDSLTSITPALVESYVAADCLQPAEYDELVEALHNLCSWAQYQDLIPENPFADRTPA